MACATDNSPPPTTTSTSASGAGGGGMGGASSSSSTSSAGGNGGGGGDLGPCGQDCSKIPTPQCLVAVCNTGQYVGTVNACVVIFAPTGTSCDDGLFCTVNETCDKGECVGTQENDCGMTPPTCSVVSCDEESKSCDFYDADDGAACTPTDLCQVDGACKAGACVGSPKDCSFSPYNECNTVACNPMDGKCTPTADAMKDGQACVLTGDLCMTGKTCMAGQCAGGMAKDCSSFTKGCFAGQCDPVNGACGGVPIPAGGACTDGIADCNTGACDANGMCIPTPVADGTACNDHNSCTNADACKAGVCAGAAIMPCYYYLEEGFESCPDGWTLSGDWECGTPSKVGPATAHTGTGCIATKIAANYSNNDAYATTTANSPPINLASATQPVLTFWTWIYTEGSTYDGYNLKVSTDNGATFTQVSTVTPAYNLTVNNQPAWGADQSMAGWQKFTADLTAYIGQTIILQYGFRSDSSGAYPGVYIDDVTVAEAAVIPLEILTTSPLASANVNVPFSATIKRAGGSSNAVWSLIPGGTNDGWLSIDPMTGALTGTPAPANAGAVSVTVHVEEPTIPANFAEKTFTFTVIDVPPPAYTTSFESCPNGWTLTGDWQCGIPTVVGPAAAHSGSSCIATQIAGNYNNGDTYAATTATSPPINLTGVAAPVLSFWTWFNTEGSTYDGFNLKISTDNGATFTQLSTVIPAYNLTVNGQPAWGGDQSGSGWQNFTANLNAYIGQTVILQFAFRSDGSGVRPGVYIDDVTVAEAAAIPLLITTSAPIGDAFAGIGYTQQVKKSGGSSASVWSIAPGGVNDSWLSINPMTGVLSGTPTAAQAGAVSVKVHVEEPSIPSNFSEKALTFNVIDLGPIHYFTNFDGMCPNGWTLTGDWQCGTPTVVGPATTFSGTQCIGTQLASNYNNSDTWAATTATSPTIDLTGTATPALKLRMWIDSEGSTYDGANLKISTDGVNYTILNNVVPAYTLTINGEPAWGGHQGNLGWQLVSVDLTAYAGQMIHLRVAFNSDSIVNYPGVYIDDVLVAGN